MHHARTYREQCVCVYVCETSKPKTINPSDELFKDTPPEIQGNNRKVHKRKFGVIIWKGLTL